jgi:hypothetical protein
MRRARLPNGTPTNSPSFAPGRISRPGSIISVSRSLRRIHSFSAGSRLCGNEAWQNPE